MRNVYVVLQLARKRPQGNSLSAFTFLHVPPFSQGNIHKTFHEYQSTKSSANQSLEQGTLQ